MTMWYGDIQGIENEADVELLQELGVEFEDDSRTIGSAPVKMNRKALDQLDSYWGRFIWSLYERRP